MLKFDEDIKRAMMSNGKSEIPTKADGTMDMRFSVNKDLVSLFKGFEMLTHQF